MTDRFSTGVGPIDRKLDGGIPPGTLVTFLAEPASQAGLFLAELARQHPTLYLSTERTPTTVTTALGDRHGPSEDVTVVSLDRDAPAGDAVQYLDRLPDESVFVVDPVEPLERTDPGQYRAFLTQLGSTLAQTDSVGILYALKHDEVPAQRHRSEYVADLVLDLVTEADDSEVESRLLVPKFRGGRALTEPIQLELTDRIAVDTSRDIA